ncbi:MAG: hypothetical protein ABI683_00595 [Ginsengibacter sp.]
MKKYTPSNIALLMLFFAVTFTSCAAIAGVFKAGIWVGIVIVVIIVAIIFWLISKANK